MLTNPSVPFDLCISVPISHLFTVGHCVFSLIVKFQTSQRFVSSSRMFSISAKEQGLRTNEVAAAASVSTSSLLLAAAAASIIAQEYFNLPAFKF